MATEAVEPQSRAGKYLTFVLADETYGLEILRVREIIGMIPITAVPRTPAFIRGVINLRGKIIPVIDLRSKFGMPHREYTRDTCMVIVDISSATGVIWIGVIVDSVSEVVDVAEAEIEKVPSFGVRVDTSFLTGLGRTRSGVKLLLNIEKVLSQEEMAALRTTGQSPIAAPPKEAPAGDEEPRSERRSPGKQERK